MSLIDRFGRKHDYLRISLTDKCNLRCHYCMPKQPCFLPGSALLTNEEILKLATIFVEDFQFRKIRLTGGEPLVRKNMMDLVRPLSRMPIELALTTNAVLLDRYLCEFRSLGIHSINISLDSLQPERYQSITSSPYFNRVIENISLAQSLGFHLKINVVVQKGINDDEIINFVKWSREENVHLRFIEFMPFNGNHWESASVITHSELLQLVAQNYAFHKLADKPGSTSRAYQVNGFLGTFAIISSISHPFCSNCNRVRLTADGKLLNCLFSRIEYDLRTPLRRDEDIRPIIESAIKSKKAQHAGLLGFQQSSDHIQVGRSMTAIGG